MFLPSSSSFPLAASRKSPSPSRSPSPSAKRADPAIVRQCVAMGFDEGASQVAALETGNESAEAAIDWIVSQQAGGAGVCLCACVCVYVVACLLSCGSGLLSKRDREVCCIAGHSLTVK